MGRFQKSVLGSTRFLVKYLEPGTDGLMSVPSVRFSKYFIWYNFALNRRCGKLCRRRLCVRASRRVLNKNIRYAIPRIGKRVTEPALPTCLTYIPTPILKIGYANKSENDVVDRFGKHAHKPATSQQVVHCHSLPVPNNEMIDDRQFLSSC